MNQNVKDIVRKMILEEISPVNTSEIQRIEDKNTMKSIINDVWNIFATSYNGNVVGGRNPKTLLRNTDMLTVVKDGTKIISAASYRVDLGGYKMFLIGCDQTTNGKEGVQKIIKTDINEYYGGYWSEVSGAIEHWFKKHDGFPIPNIYVEYLLNTTPSRYHEDGFHYDRVIGGEGGFTETKVIFGFRDKEFMGKVLNEITEYCQVRKIFNNLNEDYSGHYSDIVQRCLFAIYHIDEAYDTGTVDMLTPEMHSILCKCIQILEKQPKDKTIESSLRHAYYLLENMEVIEYHIAL